MRAPSPSISVTLTETYAISRVLPFDDIVTYTFAEESAANAVTENRLSARISDKITAVNFFILFCPFLNLVPCETETPKSTKNSCFKAGSDYTFHPKQTRVEPDTTLVCLCFEGEALVSSTQHRMFELLRVKA